MFELRNPYFGRTAASSNSLYALAQTPNKLRLSSEQAPIKPPLSSKQTSPHQNLYTVKITDAQIIPNLTTISYKTRLFFNPFVLYSLKVNQGVTNRYDFEPTISKMIYSVIFTYYLQL